MKLAGILRSLWTVHLRLGLLGLLLCVSLGCTRTSVKQSYEAQAAEYFLSVLEVASEYDALSKKTEQSTELLKRVLDGKDIDQSRELIKGWLQNDFNPILGELEQILSNLQKIKPPERLQTYHNSLATSLKSELGLSKDFQRVVSEEDWQGIQRISAKTDSTPKTFHANITSGLREAGFSSIADINRVINMRKAPLAWGFAFVIMIVATAFCIWIIRILFTMFLALISPLLFLAVKWDEEGRLTLSKVSKVSFAVIVAIAVSLVGPAIAAMAEYFMFPRTELSPWFVYLIMGWNALGFAMAGSREEPHNPDSFAMMSSCSWSISCLIGYLWAAISKASLIGPWQWVNQMTLQWLN